MAQSISSGEKNTMPPYTTLDSKFGTVVPSNFWGSPVLRLDDGTVWCPGYSGETYSKRIWDFVQIAGVPYDGPSQPQTPGLCFVTCDKHREVDKKKIKGGDGARITLAGLQPATVEIEVHIWTPQQLLEFDILRTVIFPGPQKVTTTKLVPPKPITGSQFFGTANQDGIVSGQLFTIPIVQAATAVKSSKSVTLTQAFDASHPVLDIQGVRSLVFVGVSGPETSSRIPGAKFFTLKAMEFLLPKKGNDSTTTPTGALARKSVLDTASPTPGSNTRNLGP